MLNSNNSALGSHRESVSVLSWLASAAMPWRKSDGSKGQCIRPVFVGEWRQSDEVCSVVLAQAPALSARYRRLFLLDAAKLVVPSIGAELRDAAERDAAVGRTKRSRVFGEVTVFVRFDGGLVVGIENAKPRELEGKPRLRYSEYLRLRNSNPILMMLVPRANTLSNEEAKTLDRFEAFSCEGLTGWADGCLMDWLGHAAPALESILRDLTNQPSTLATSERNLSDAMQCSLG